MSSISRRQPPLHKGTPIFFTRFQTTGHTLSLLITMGLMCCITSGCKTQTSDTKPVETRASSFLMAAQYNDKAQLFADHIESTPRGSYCTSQAFTRALEKAKQSKNEKSCKQAKVMTQHGSKIQKEALLAAQIIRYACQQQRPTCMGYAKHVFHSKLLQHPSFGSEKIKRFTIKKTIVSSERATVYVDLDIAKTNQVRHTTLELSKGPEGWRIERSWLDEP